MQITEIIENSPLFTLFRKSFNLNTTGKGQHSQPPEHYVDNNLLLFPSSYHLFSGLTSSSYMHSYMFLKPITTKNILKACYKPPLYVPN